MRPGKPSNTALIVAAGLQLVHHDPRYRQLVPTLAAHHGAALLKAAHPLLARLLGQAWFRTICSWLERVTLPGILLHYALRKRALRNHARASIEAGCRQVVVLGAGFDTLCMELQADYPQVGWIEIDHPATQKSKLLALDSTAAKQSIHYISAELDRQNLFDVLRGCSSYRPEYATLFVAEGLLMYLPEAAVARLFGQMAAAAPDNRIAFTWFEPQADGRPNFSKPSRLVDLWLRTRGEPFISGVARHRLGDFLSGCGFSPLALGESADAPGSPCAGPLPHSALPAGGEYICLAIRRPGVAAASGLA